MRVCKEEKKTKKGELEEEHARGGEITVEKIDKDMGMFIL